MDWKKEFKILGWISAIFLFVFFMPIENFEFRQAIDASLDLARWYAQEHVILCLLPAFFIAGTISIFVSQAAVLKYFGANAKKWLAYTIASVSGSILAVCSCTILPLFSSIHKRGAGLGPAVTFLYSGPAINILAIILTARILGWEMGLARTIGAVVFSILIGLTMAFIYRTEERDKAKEQRDFKSPPEKRPLWQTAIHFFILVAILVFANWGKPASDDSSSFWFYLWSYKWYITSIFSIGLMFSLIYFLNIKWFKVLLAAIPVVVISLLTANPLIAVLVGIAGLATITIWDGGENQEWTYSSWDFAKQIIPLLGIGVIIAGFLLGSTHDNVSIPGVIPNEWIAVFVGGNSLMSNLFASVLGAFMYFATLTEVPIIQGLLNSGMGEGPALSLLLAGPALSLPNMLVIRSVMGTKKTLIFVLLVIVFSTLGGMIFGNIV